MSLFLIEARVMKLRFRFHVYPFGPRVSAESWPSCSVSWGSHVLSSNARAVRGSGS